MKRITDFIKWLARGIGWFIGWVLAMMFLAWVKVFLIHDLGLTHVFFVEL